MVCLVQFKQAMSNEDMSEIRFFQKNHFPNCLVKQGSAHLHPYAREHLMTWQAKALPVYHSSPFSFPTHNIHSALVSHKKADDNLRLWPVTKDASAYPASNNKAGILTWPSPSCILHPEELCSWFRHIYGPSHLKRRSVHNSQQISKQERNTGTLA